MATAAPFALVYTHITKVPGVCGGKAAIDNTRVRVNNVVSLIKGGFTPERVAEEAYPQLSLGQVHAALAYYYDHVEEIEAELAAQNGREERIERDRAEYLRTHAAK